MKKINTSSRRKFLKKSLRTYIENLVANGLTYRPLATTIKDTYDWWNSAAVSQERKDKFINAAEGIFHKEAAIIKTWKERK